MFRRGFGRTVIAGSCCLALTLGFAMVGSADAGAADGFHNGKATAVAQIQRIAPGVGSLQLATSTGRTIADLANNLAQAQAQSVDLGLVGTALTAEQCDGSPGAVRPDQLPKPTTVDNRNGDAAAATDDFPVPGGALGGGREEAQATRQPSSVARVSASEATIGPVVKLSGGQSEAVARVVDGNAREAIATASLDLDIAGLVQLRGLQWRALHRTGEAPKAEGTFAVASAAVGSVPLPVDELTPLQDAVNTALEATGITIEMPHVVRLTEPNDIVQVTPLRLTLKDSPAGKAALGPGLNLTREQREQLFDTIVRQVCTAAGLLLVGDISVDVVSGTGFLIVDFGGAEAASGDLELGNPFGDFVPLTAVEGVAGANATFANGAPVAAPAGAAAVQAPADLGPLTKICESLHTTRKPLCSRGMGVPVGIAGIALTSGIGFLDWRRQRRLLAPTPDTPAS